MNTTTRISTAERIGRTFGCGWRAYARGERRMSHWLVSMGVPAAGAAALVLMVKLVALGVLLYTTFWLTLLLVCVMVVAWMARNAYLGEELPEPEWRNGPAGFGLYTHDGFRIDPHVEDD
ncbi:FIG00976384: hypothetical protein [plant metagenome]|uniref:DUF3742 family protein n=1 Tax=plant metagenome TaxID=1297885 RepID=A0A484Y0R0_9ZZZZ